MNQVLMQAIVEAAMFLALSGDDAIQEDAAVTCLEQLAFTLKRLSTMDREAFVRYVAQLEAEERAGGGNERADFLASLGDNLGLI
jgi:hypothetical protein